MREPLPCILDIEASGFGRRSYPIEVGYVLPDGRSRCTLIRPLPQWTHWDEQAERLHGITRGALQAHGRPAHDYTWLGALFDGAGLQPAFKLESVRVLLTESLLARLPELQREALQRMGVDRHRASNDARALQWAIERAAVA